MKRLRKGKSTTPAGAGCGAISYARNLSRATDPALEFKTFTKWIQAGVGRENHPGVFGRAHFISGRASLLAFCPAEWGVTLSPPPPAAPCNDSPCEEGRTGVPRS